MAPSLCTVKYVRQYFTDGTLPKPGTVCQTDLGLFDSVGQQGMPGGVLPQGRLNMNQEDKLLFKAIRELSSSPFSYFGFGLPFQVGKGLQS